jgi:DNA-binding response OmpR family regulator
VVARSEFDFHRQCIVVADDESAAATFLVDTLRRDGHRVTHVSDVGSASFDVALGACHLFICGSGIGGMRAVNLIAELRDNAPELPILCVAAPLRWTRRLEGRLPADVTILREPLTEEGLRAGVRPLLPLSSGGTTLAWPALVERPIPETPDERPRP